MDKKYLIENLTTSLLHFDNRLRIFEFFLTSEYLNYYEINENIDNYTNFFNKIINENEQNEEYKTILININNVDIIMDLYNLIINVFIYPNTNQTQILQSIKNLPYEFIIYEISLDNILYSLTYNILLSMKIIALEYTYKKLNNTNITYYINDYIDILRLEIYNSLTNKYPKYNNYNIDEIINKLKSYFNLQ